MVGLATMVPLEGQILCGSHHLPSLLTGRPFTPTAPSVSPNSVGSGPFADCLSAPVKLSSPDGWWDPSTMADLGEEIDPPRFVTCGSKLLRGPGLINVDIGIFRKFQPAERLSIQFRGEICNVSNTPHFANATSNIASSDFSVPTTWRIPGVGPGPARVPDGLAPSLLIAFRQRGGGMPPSRPPLVLLAAHGEGVPRRIAATKPARRVSM